MDGRLRRHRGLAVWWALLVLAAGLSLVVAAGSVHAQAGSDGWQPCGSTTGSTRIERIEILLALDRSGSLENVDPNGTRRRRAVHGTRERLSILQESVSQVLSKSAARSDFGIDVAMVAFNTTGETVAAFGRVGADHPSDAAIDRALGSEGDTDYGPAIEQALARFETSPNVDSDTTCRILVVFTDGILDPYDTAAGRRPSEENKAVAHVSNLLSELCDPDPGMSRYRQRMDDLGVSTYVAVLRGPNFDRGGGGTHLDALASASKQTILALTGHGDSPLLDGVASAPRCEAWSGIRAGKVIEIEDIGALTDELANAVGEVGLAVRQPRVRCAREPKAEADLAGEWPHSLAVRSPLGESLCTVAAPLDGEMILTLADRGGRGGVEWLIDDGIEQVRSRRLSAGHADLSFDIVSTLLPSDEAAGAVVDAEVEILSVWSPEPQPGWPEQPPQVRQPTMVRFDVPDREQQWVERLIDCRVHRRATWVDAVGGARVEAGELCAAQAPPAGEFEIALASSAGNRLLWSASDAVAGDRPTEPPRGEPIRLAPGDEAISLGGISELLAANEIPYESFADAVRFTLTWRSPRGAVLVERPVADVEIEVRPASVDLLECGDEAQVTAAVEGPAGAGALVVDTGCTLVSRSRGTVRATASGDLGGVTWLLVDPPPTAGASWPPRAEIDLAPSEADRTLFVGIEHPGLAEFAGADVEFALVAAWSDEGSDAREEQRESRSVTVYLPVPRCEGRVEADRVDVEPSGGESPEQRARVRNLCEIDSPPNGHLEIRAADATPGVDLSWQPARGGDTADFLRVEAGADQVAVGAMSAPLSHELLRPLEAGVDIEVTWHSARGHVSESRRRVVVGIPEEAPELLECAGRPQMLGLGEEVPEGPVVVDTGCVLLAPEVGTVALDVEGGVAGVRWRLTEPVRLAPGDADRPIVIETAGLMPNEPHNLAASFELVASLSFDGYEPPADRKLREVAVRLERRLRIRCAGTPAVVNAPVEVPEGPLVVDTGCILLAPSAGTLTVSVEGDVAGVPWGLSTEVLLGPDDDDLPILIETTAPLQNRRYDTVAEFALAATWRSSGGVEQAVGEQPPPGQAPPGVAVVLRARPDIGGAVLIAVVLLLAGLVAAWLVMWLVGRRANRPPEPGEYRVVRHDVTAVASSGGRLQLPGFDAAAAVAGGTQPIGGRRSRLQAAGLTIRARVRWWNPRDVLEGGRAEAVPQNRRDLFVAVSPSSDRPGCLPVGLAHGAVIVAVDRAPTVSRTGAGQHRGQVWILIRPRATEGSTEQTVKQNLDTALRELGRRLGGRPAASAPAQPKG